METLAVSSTAAASDTPSSTSGSKEIDGGFAQLLECLFANLMQPNLSTAAAVEVTGQTQTQSAGSGIENVLCKMGNTDTANLVELLKSMKQFADTKLQDGTSTINESWMTELLSKIEGQGTDVPSVNESEQIKTSDLFAGLDEILKPQNSENAKNPINVNQMQKLVEEIVQALSANVNSTGSMQTQESGDSAVSDDSNGNAAVQVVNDAPVTLSKDEVKAKLMEYIASLKPERHLSKGAENQLDRVIDASIQAVSAKDGIAKTAAVSAGTLSSEDSTSEKDGQNEESSSLNDVKAQIHSENNIADRHINDLQNKAVENSKNEKSDVAFIRKDSDVVDVVVNKFKTLKLPEVTELTVKLRPEQLGDITVSVVLEKGQITGSINASNREIANVIQNQLDTLKQDLKNNGVNLNNITVKTNTDDSFSFNQSRNFFNQGEQKRNHRNFNEAFEETVINQNSDDEGFEILA